MAEGVSYSQQKGPIVDKTSQHAQKTEIEDFQNDNNDISLKSETKYDDDDPYSRTSSANNSDDDDDNFDWDQEDPEEKKNAQDDEVYHERHFFLCLSRSSSKLSWICFVVLTAISVAVCVAVFVAVKPQSDPTMASYNLALWFTFIAFMFCVTFVMQMIIEIIPWLIKKLAGIFAPHKTEVLRARLSYYMALRTYTKLVSIGAWLWGSWAFLRHHLELPQGAIRPNYVKTLELVWESFFLLTLFVFVEKFFLQLIVTSFHKKAYGERLYQNERALRILDKLKRVKRVGSAQDFLLKKIIKKSKGENKWLDSGNNDSSTTIVPKSIINNNTETSNNNNKNNVKFPSNKQMDVTIPIPPVNNREPEQVVIEEEKKPGYMKSFSQKVYMPKKKDERSEEEKIEKVEEADEERLDRNTEDFEKQTRPRLNRSNTELSISSSYTSVSNNLHLLQGYKKLIQESAFQNPVAQAKQLAKRIYHNIMGDHPVRKYVIESDLYPFFRTIENAKEAFELFDTDANGDISRHEMRAGCIRIYRDRKNLARSMRDMSQATGKLDVIMLVVFVCIWIIVVLAVFGVNVSTQLTPLWSAFIAASFIFGNSAKDAFESIIFVFVTHPFDAGDRIFLGNENWVVHNVGLSVSTFLKWDGSVVYAKNSVLATQYIINCRRTGRTTETIDIQISYHTPSWKIQSLRNHMATWCNKFPKLYTKDSCDINILALENLNKISIQFYFEHTKNWQEPGGRWLRHNDFMLELKDELQRLDIRYTNPEQPVIHTYAGEKDDDDIELPSRKEGSLYQRVPWSTGRVNGGDMGNGVPSVDGPVGNGNDAGASAGAAATATLATGLI